MASSQDRKLVEIKGSKSSSGYFQTKEFLSVDEIYRSLQNRYLTIAGEKMKENIEKTHSDLFLGLPVEFPVNGLHHTTILDSMREILDTQSFKGKDHDMTRANFMELSFWAADVSSSDIEKAQEEAYTYVLTHGPQGVEKFREEITQQFANSPAFNKSASRYGNFRFSLPFSDLLSLYGSQFCGGEKPQLSILGTDTYKQEIAHYVVVHSPDNQRFKDHPRVPSLQTRGEPLPFVYWMDETLYWRPQSTSDALSVLSTKVDITGCPLQSTCSWFNYRGHCDHKVNCVWNQLVFAFHIPRGAALEIPVEELIDNLSTSEILEPYLKDSKMGKTTAEKHIKEVKKQYQGEDQDSNQKEQ